MQHSTMHTSLLSGLTSVSDVNACYVSNLIFNNAHFLTNFAFWPCICVEFHCMFHTLAVWTFNNVRLLTTLWPYDCLWRYCIFHTLHTLAPSMAHYNSPSPPLRHASSIFIPVGKQNTFSVKKWCSQEKLKGLVPSRALSGCCGLPAKN